MVTGRTTSTTKGDKKHVSSYTVHTFPAPPKYRSVHARDRLQNVLGLDEEASLMRIQAARVPGGMRLLPSAPVGARSTGDHRSRSVPRGHHEPHDEPHKPPASMSSSSRAPSESDPSGLRTFFELGGKSANNSLKSLITRYCG